MTRHRLMPADTPDYMADAWAGCICWAGQEPEIMAAFRADTGEKWQPPTTGFERMIDEATEREAAFMERFILWANVNVWGPMDA